MVFHKRWNARLTFAPALTAADLETALTYVGHADYSNQYDGWDWWVTSPAERASERRGCFGAGSPGAAGADSGMRAAIKGALNRVIAKRYPLGAMEWRDEHLGDNTPYRAQDVGKLLRVLRKRKIDVNGTITGEGFAVEGNVLFVVHSCLHAAKIVTYAGEQVYIDEESSDAVDEEEPLGQEEAIGTLSDEERALAAHEDALFEQAECASGEHVKATEHVGAEDSISNVCASSTPSGLIETETDQEGRKRMRFPR